MQIKLPFYIQGFFIGVLSSSLAYILFKRLYGILSNALSFVLSDLSGVSHMLLIGMILTGAVSGLLATRIALHNFNKTSKRVAKITKK